MTATLDVNVTRPPDPETQRVVPWWESAHARLWGVWPENLIVERDLVPIADWLARRSCRPALVADGESEETFGGLYLYIMPIRSALNPLGNRYAIADRDRAHDDLGVFLDGYRKGLAVEQASTRVHRRNQDRDHLAMEHSERD